MFDQWFTILVFSNCFKIFKYILLGNIRELVKNKVYSKNDNKKYLLVSFAAKYGSN